MHHQIPPANDPRRAAMAQAVSSCVHCGFCLPACPTYKVLGEEMDSPRGRIVLMKAVLEGALPLADAAPHLDRCLGCLACETACPSGVRYRDLIEPMREDLVARRPAADRLQLGALLGVMASPGLFRVAAAVGAGAKPLAPALPAPMRAMLDLLPARLPSPEMPPALTAAQGRRRGRVALMTGCVQQVLRPGVTAAAIRVLAANGVEVVVPAEQGCCGALARHAGDHAGGTTLAAAHAARFPADVDAVLATAAGCGSSMKDTHTGGAPVLDVLEYLDRLGPVTPLALPEPARVAYQDACHLAHAQQITAAPRRLLGLVSGLTLVPLAESGLCCGSAGLYNIEQPDLAAALGRRKADAVAASGATLVVSANIGCLTQIGASLAAAGHAVDVTHAVELLAMALPRRHGSQ
ncbi:MAG: 4Fe-4S dicluster domain-containing protein [Acidobacteria bacterium]|nr:4Fe-4S dicluster domain-containing protein [Acidobacteriota bacterium]